MARMLDGMEAMLRGEVPPPPAATLHRDAARGVLAWRGARRARRDRRARQSDGHRAGRRPAAVADAAMGRAYMTTLGDGESYTTVEMT